MGTGKIIKKKPVQQGRGKSKTATELDELNQSITLLQQRLAQLEDLMRDGFPYGDAMRPRIQVQIRETIRQIFGEDSQLYQRSKDQLLKSTSQADVAQTVVVLKGLVQFLEDQRLRLMGLPPRQSPSPQSISTSGSATASGATAGAPSPGSQAAPPPGSNPVPAAPPPQVVPSPATSPGTNAPPPHAAPAPANPPVQPASAERPLSPPGDTRATQATPSGSGTFQDAMLRLRKIGDRFHSVARQLKLRGEYRPTIEVDDQQDVQDLFSALLRFEFDDVAIEEWMPSYTGRASQPIFLVHQGQIAVVLKKTQTGRGAKEITEELGMDGKQCNSYPGCVALFCFVYDPEGRIGNPRGLESEVSRRHEPLSWYLLISPK